MTRVVFDQEIMGLIGVIGRLVKVPIKDLFKEGDVLYCIVEPGQIGKAIGKGGENIRRVNNILKKKVKFVEYGVSAVNLVRNLIYPTRVDDIREVEGVVEIESADRKVKGFLIGRSGSNLEFLNRVVRRYFDVEVKVV